MATIYSDARGRYEFRGLPAGEYTVSARPSQYQGQFLAPVTPPGGPPRLTLADGQVIDGHDLPLVRAGAIVGRLVDADGDPLSGVNVSAQRVGQSFTSYSTIFSDEHGRYRLYRLMPGDYAILAKPVTDGDNLGSDAVITTGYVDTYHPSTSSRDEATPVRVRGGEETAAGDLVLIRARLLRISGTVLDSRGSPATARTTVFLARENKRASFGTGPLPGGLFSFRAQPPGKYRVIARLREGTPDLDIEYASLPINLIDSDLQDLVLRMKPAATVSGRIVFEAGSPPAVPGNTLHVYAQETTEALFESRNRSGSVGKDLSFTLGGLGDNLIIRPAGVPAGWTLKGVFLGNTDITDVPTEFRDADTGRLQVVLTTRASQVSGTVTDEKGQPAAAAQVVLFPEDKTYWFPMATRLRFGGVGRDGRFAYDGLPAGRYYLIALPPERTIGEHSIDTLEALVAEATALFIGADEQRQVDLKLAAITRR